MNFTLISEGWLRNQNTYGDAITLKVRLHSLVSGPNAKYFDVPSYMSLDTYLTSLLISNNRKYQIVNINLDDIDDDFAKVITKLFSRLIFSFSKSLVDRASIPFHIILEEAHRYVQNDTDRFLLGYNIYERIAKEGRKYGVILGIITQRPVELSDTVISQCSNFLIFRINHPVDVEYIRKMVPNISDEIVEKQKNLQSGTCLGFGNAFRIPMIVRMEMPNPAPWSGNCDVVKFWNGGQSGAANFVSSAPSNNVQSTPVSQVKEVVQQPSVSQNFTMPTIQAPTDFDGQNKFDDSFVMTSNGKTVDDIKKQIADEEKMAKIQSMFFNPDDLEAAKAEEEEENKTVVPEEDHMVNLSATGGVVLTDLNNQVENTEVPNDNLPSLDSKPLVDLVDGSKSEELQSEPTKVVDLTPGISMGASSEKVSEHKGFLEMLGGSGLSKLMGNSEETIEEEMGVGTSMSVQDAKNLISLSEIPAQTGGDGFLAPTSLLSVPSEPSNITLSDGSNQ